MRPDGALAYARRVMVNHDIDGHRARRRSLPVAEPPEQPVADSTSGFAERDGLGRLLATLPAQQRRVVVLRYLHDLSEKEVAAELGLPLGTVKSSAARGLSALRVAMEHEDAERG